MNYHDRQSVIMRHGDSLRDGPDYGEDDVTYCRECHQNRFVDEDGICDECQKK